MPEDIGLDTSITRTGWKESDSQNSERPVPKRRKRKAQDASEEPGHASRPSPPDGVGTKIDVTA